MNSREVTTQGKVTSRSNSNTIKVRVEKKQPHPIYKKIVTSHTNYLVHCTNADVNVGDVVTIKSVRPISKQKTWQYLSTVSKA